MAENKINKPQTEEEKKKKKGVVLWWGNLGKGARTAICILGGAAVATAITVPTVIAAKSCSSEKKTIKCDSTEVTFSSSFEADGSLKANIKPSLATKEIEKLEIKIGDYTLKDSEYTFNKESGDLVISANIIKAHKGNIVIKPTLKDKETKTGANIDWNTTQFNIGGTTQTLYKFAQSATNIIFKKDSATDGVLVGETANDKIYANYADNTLTIWSNDVIKFTDNDLVEGYEGAKAAFFRECKDLVSIKLNNIDTSEVTTLEDLFASDGQLESADLSNLDTSNVTNMRAVFYNCPKLSKVKFGANFKTDKVTLFDSFFDTCRNLKSIDLTNFDTAKVVKMDRMFAECSNIEIIYVSEKFVTTAPGLSGEGMFDSCYNLYGDSGTSYDGDETGKDRAHIDEGEDNPGYFTRKANLPSKTKFVDRFNGLKNEFNNDTIAKFANSQIKLNKWNGEAVTENVTAVNYTYEPKQVTITTGTSITSPVRIDPNYLGDLSSLLSETDPRVSYEIYKNYIIYTREADSNEDGIYKLKINKFGYIEELVEKGNSNYSYLLNYTGSPDLPEVLDSLTQSGQTYIKDSFTLEPNKKYIFTLPYGPDFQKLKIEDSNGNINLKDYLRFDDDMCPTIYWTDGHNENTEKFSYDATNKFLCLKQLQFGSPNYKITLRTLGTIQSTSGLKITVYS